ncbi:hypothetical protein Ava_B0259 (plasmid) [Trichormus variabilis ATCC 29413]|uniref:Uncharacterized protein n=2 Tax=Anabaena variabilis TaxID=264691 RepID=Q3M216_TRIV2|nr:MULTISPECIES: hypothetical protein [Nostocaceae]ABA24970.1 hypothetical protein Ava_B0259 [Trichormus variabilis ATCC 29413]MBC1217806.1 hypothetical protein [Trichormus variabilis ARAD]MBC1259086.1 hypothetical protein [Trichormus variabilis V5]MBC1305594.1 hypothetical protein [Trichormus variabilis N2B]MBC1314610.1 hypothetical protein [Trichormus variabilis PNB]
MNKITHQITQTKHLERIQKIEIITRKRRTMKRLKSRCFVNQTLTKFALYSIVTTGFLGVAALGCWGFEIIDANSKPTIFRGDDWQAHKNVCLGGMVVAFSGFLGSALLGVCLDGTEVQEPKN